MAGGDTKHGNHTESNQSERGRNRPSERGAVAGRRMSAVARVRSDSGARSHAERGARGLAGISQDGARTNAEMRQYAPPRHEARSPTGVSRWARVRGERPRAHERSERKRSEERTTERERRTGMTEPCEPHYNAIPIGFTLDYIPPHAAARRNSILDNPLLNRLICYNQNK